MRVINSGMMKARYNPNQHNHSEYNYRIRESNVVATAGVLTLLPKRTSIIFPYGRGRHSATLDLDLPLQV